jgi:hypothetical protein
MQPDRDAVRTRRTIDVLIRVLIFSFLELKVQFFKIFSIKPEFYCSGFIT